jgi:glutathione S-transferase
MSSVKLTYFDAPGRAEPIRIALRLSGMPFEDHRLKFPDFMGAKARGDFPLGSVPVLELNGEKITQTGAILRYIARVGDRSLYPEDALAALRVDSALDTFNDTFSAALMPSLFERDMERKLAMRAEFAAGPMKRVFDYAEGLLASSGGPFLGGAQLSIADLVVGQQLKQIHSGGLDGVAPAALEAWPRLSALLSAYLAHPRLQG